MNTTTNTPESRLQTARVTYGSPAPSAHDLNLASMDDNAWWNLGHDGYVPLERILPGEFMDELPGEIDRLAGAGFLQAPADRIVRGVPTERLALLGVVHGNQPGAPIFRASPMVSALYAAAQRFGNTFNARRAQLIASGLVTEAEAPEIAVEGLDMNLNRVVAGWSGLHPHQDQLRFTPGAMRLAETSIRHILQRARVVTVSGYARPLNSWGRRVEDLGGALTFHLRRHARGPEDKAIHDVVAARHGTGAVFFAATTHGVARMTVPGSVRYSFQAFFPTRTAWEAVAQRIAAGELERELKAVRHPATTQGRI